MLQAKKNCLCPNNILYQKYNILFLDDLSITRYNKFCQIRNLSFRGLSTGDNKILIKSNFYDLLMISFRSHVIMDEIS